MNQNTFDDFRYFVENALLPAIADITNLGDANRKHVQKLVYTNLVDRFDVLIDNVILDNCRHEYLVAEAMKNMTQQITESDLFRFLMHGDSIQSVIDNRLKDVLRLTVLRQRHSKKLSAAFKVMGADDTCWNKPRVNNATGKIFQSITPRQHKTPYSICGYADWLYSRRNSIVHGAGSMKLLDNDVKQLETMFKCKPAKTFNVKLSSIKIASTFYNDVIKELSGIKSPNNSFKRTGPPPGPAA